MASYLRPRRQVPITGLGNTWSFAVEEQFYFLAPALLLIVPRRFTAHVLLIGIVLAPLTRIAYCLLSPIWSNATYGGAGCGHRKSSATCDSSASAGGGHSVKASTGPADQCRHDVAMAIAHIAHAGRLAADGELHGGPSTVRVAPVGARRSSWNC
jgi:hypothetical protein